MNFDSHARKCAQVLKQLISCQIDLAMHGFLDQNRLEGDFTKER